MHWRSPNNIRAMREIQPDLGDCVPPELTPARVVIGRGDETEPMCISDHIAVVVVATICTIGAGALAFLIGAIVVIAFQIMSANKASSHGPADWINRGGYKNGVGEFCCGERDCFELPSSDIQITPRGYLIKSINELVPFHEATPSPTGTYWRCYWGGKRKCFFAPPGSA